ncbi:MAG: hypothetical protein H0S85_12965 [Desulfovibrionaceae bacterium]|nr:hypothetical protein [Desulfovibrionaceae bacterium]
MIPESDKITPLYRRNGELHGVLLSPELWEAVKDEIGPILCRAVGMCAQPEERPEPLDDWEEFKAYWDFKYPFSAAVECAECGAHTDDWEHDEDHNFRLSAASLGGLVVFECRHCKSRILKRHFKDAIKFECRPCED